MNENWNPDVNVGHMIREYIRNHRGIRSTALPEINIALNIFLVVTDQDSLNLLQNDFSTSVFLSSKECQRLHFEVMNQVLSKESPKQCASRALAETVFGPEIWSLAVWTRLKTQIKHQRDNKEFQPIFIHCNAPESVKFMRTMKYIDHTKTSMFVGDYTSIKDQLEKKRALCFETELFPETTK